MKPSFLLIVRATILSLIGAAAASAQISGSVQTAAPAGITVPGDTYKSKNQVFFTAGPQNQKASGLPDGKYFFQVTDPTGSVLLSSDRASCRQVVVTNGRLAGSYQTPLFPDQCAHTSTTTATGAVAVQVGTYARDCAIGASGPDLFCDTPNPGGEYKLWLIAQNNAVSKCETAIGADGFSLSFEPSCAKTASFRTEQPAVSRLSACVFNDTNSNGNQDPGELMVSGWNITAAVPSSSFVTLRSDTKSGAVVTAATDSKGCVSFAALGIPANTQVPVTLTEENVTGWTQTGPAAGTYDTSGNLAATGPTFVAGSGIISVNLSPGATVTTPKFANNTPQCPDCSILNTVTALNIATPSKLYAWGISKSVDKTEIDSASGASATFNYTVSVTHDTGAGSMLTGTITLINADPLNPFITLNVVDAVSDGGVCKIQDPATGAYVPEVLNLFINRFAEKVLPYRCAYSGPSPVAGTNTVTATATNLNSPWPQYTGAANYDFSTATAVADQTATIADSLKGALGAVSYTDPSPRTFTYSQTFSGDPAGTCTPHDNTATLTTATTGTTASSSQSVKVCVKNTVTLSTTASPTAVTRRTGIYTVILKDSATIAGGINPTGSIAFTLLYQGQTVYTETVPVDGNGTYTTPLGYTLPYDTLGVLQWNATYSGDANHSSVSESGNPGEQVVIASLGSIIDSGLNATLEYPDGARASASVDLLGGLNPTGSITFKLVNYSSTVCTFTVPVNGAGTYSTPGSCWLSAGDAVQWQATYSGDARNAGQTTISSFHDVKY